MFNENLHSKNEQLEELSNKCTGLNIIAKIQCRIETGGQYEQIVGEMRKLQTDYIQDKSEIIREYHICRTGNRNFQSTEKVVSDISYTISGSVTSEAEGSGDISTSSSTGFSANVEVSEINSSNPESEGSGSSSTLSGNDAFNASSDVNSYSPSSGSPSASHLIAFDIDSSEEY